MKTKELSGIMHSAWAFFRISGQSFSECLRIAWRNYKLVQKMQTQIVKFYFQKIDGSCREAYGTFLGVADQIKGDRRAKNNTVQVYYDTEKQAFRCFKKLNLLSIA